MARNSWSWTLLGNHGPGVRIALWIYLCAADGDLINPTSDNPDAALDTNRQNLPLKDATYPEVDVLLPVGVANNDSPLGHFELGSITSDVSEPPTKVEDLNTLNTPNTTTHTSVSPARWWELWQGKENFTMDQSAVGGHNRSVKDTNYFSSINLSIGTPVETIENYDYTTSTSASEEHTSLTEESNLEPVVNLRTKRSAVWLLQSLPELTSLPWQLESSTAGNWTHPPTEPTIKPTEAMEDTTPNYRNKVIICSLVLLIVVMSISGIACAYKQRRTEEGSNRRVRSLNKPRRARGHWRAQRREARNNYLSNFGSLPTYVSRNESLEMVDLSTNPTTAVADTKMITNTKPVANVVPIANPTPVPSYTTFVRTRADITLSSTSQMMENYNYALVPDEIRETVGQPHLL